MKRRKIVLKVEQKICLVINAWVERNAFKKKETKINQKRQSKTILAHAKPIKEQYFLWFTEANIVKATTLRITFAEELLWLEYLTQI